MVFIGPLITVGVIVLAFGYGGRAEREAGWVALAALATFLGLATVFGLHRQLPIALADVVLTGGFLLLCFRHRRMWLYAEAALAAGLTVYQVVSDQELELSAGYRLVVNGMDCAALLILTGAIIARRRHAFEASSITGAQR